MVWGFIDRVNQKVKSFPFMGVRKLFFGLSAGTGDEIISTFTNKEITIADDIARKLIDCEPWSYHLDNDVIKLFHESIKKGDGESARAIVDVGRKKSANKFCIEMLMNAATIVADKAPDILVRALPGYYY